MKIQLKRGEAQNRTSVTPDVGEPLFASDTKELYIGDGTTPGGFPVGTIKPTGSITNGAVAVFAGTSGKALASIPKTTFLADYATTDYVNQLVTGTTPGIKVKNAEHADTATNAQSLNGHSDYLRQGVISNSYTSTSTTHVASSKALKTAYDLLNAAVTRLKSSVNSLTSKVNSLTGTVVDIGNRADAANTTVSRVSRDLHSHTQVANTKFNLIDSAVAQLRRLPGRITAGTANPSGGSNGDVYIQYS